MAALIQPHDPPPNYTCQMCGQVCPVQEVVNVGGWHWDCWGYCPDCDIETFHMAHGYSKKEVEQGYADN